jgi:hypothetical protein
MMRTFLITMGVTAIIMLIIRLIVGEPLAGIIARVLITGELP